MFLLTLIFAVVHSGLASLRDPGEKLIGERAFRVLFAGTSLPLAVSTIVSFVVIHRLCFINKDITLVNLIISPLFLYLLCYEVQESTEMALMITYRQKSIPYSKEMLHLFWNNPKRKNSLIYIWLMTVLICK